MAWTYEQATGEMRAPDGTVVATGYAGLPPYKNDPTAEARHDQGPLPRGGYTIGDVVEGTHMGPFAIRLTPDPANEMFGRGAFFIHGDSIEHPGQASNGCIIMPSAIRHRIAASDDKALQVV